LSDSSSPIFDGFQEHFEKNYAKKVEGYIKWARWQVLSTKLIVIILVALIIASILLTLSISISVEQRSIPPTSMMVFFFCWVAFILLSGLWMGSLKVKEKDILVFLLLGAANKYKAFQKEVAQQQFLDECISELLRFNKRLERLLSDMQMPLKLPIISELHAFSDNIKNKIIPALRQRKDYPATLQAGNYGEVFVSMAKLFFYEKDYEELPEINKTISERLRDIKAEPERVKGNRAGLFMSKRTLLPVSFVIFTAVVLFLVYALRAMNAEVTSYWSYVAENAATIAVGIAAGWATIIVLIYRKPTTKE